MFAILVAVPLVIAAFLALLLPNTKIARYIALMGSVVSLFLAYQVSSNANTIESVGWFSFSSLSVSISASTMPLNIIMLMLVAIITPLIIIYSIGFMDLPSEQNRFYFEICLFAASMMLFAVAADFITMFIGWELLGITSYLLIGFWYKRERAPTAARKAITTILFGDILMFIALLLIWGSFQTFSFAAIMQSAQYQSLRIPLLLIALAVFTKSAQFPFHEWLPDAMEGPTPVSAFLHSSTMVKAGVFLIAVLLPLYSITGMLFLILYFGLISAMVGATNALTEKHIKRILAYSTIEDLGLMFVALGANALIAAMLLFIAQTFYKALLFMSAGAAMKANKEEENIDRIYNFSSHKPLFIATIVGVASIAGIFPLSGFFGKIGIEISAASMQVYVVLLGIELISSIYIFRWLFVPIKNAPEKLAIDVKINYKSTPKSMLLPIYVLAILVIAGSLVYLYVPQYLSQYSYPTVQIGYQDIAIESTVVAAGFLVAYRTYFKKSGAKLESRHRNVYKILYNSILTNEFYINVTKFFYAMAYSIDNFDFGLYKIVKREANTILEYGDVLKRMETGKLNTYIIVFILGLLLLILIFIL